MRNVRFLRPGRLHDGNQAPEAAGQRIIATDRRLQCCIRLADGATGGIIATGALAIAAGDFMPINGVLLGANCNGHQQQSQK